MSQLLAKVVRSLEELERKAISMECGGDLEGLIEAELAVVNRQAYEMCLAAREQSVSASAEDFPPCAVPVVPASDAVASGKGAPCANASGRGGV